MATVQRDFRGMKCPVPTLKMHALLTANEVKPGDLLEVVADCPTFEADVKKLCANWKKQLIKFQVDGDVKTAVIKI